MKTLTSNFRKLIALLNDYQFHTGNQLGKKLNLSRNAIWKIIHQLQEFGINIDSSQQNGYKLNQPLILLESQKIKSYLSKKSKEKIEKIFTLGSIDSTNDFLKSNISKDSNKISVCLSEHQSQGKGRLGRTWESPFGTNIYLSLRFKTHKDISQLSGLSIAVGLGIIHTLNAHIKKSTLNQFMLKWPNDIFWKDEKIGGILIEIQAESHGATDIIIGIGINTNQHNHSTRLCLENILKQTQDRNILTAYLIEETLNTLEKFDAKSLSGFIEEYRQYDYLYNKPVQLTLHQKTSITGIAKGINALGHLLIQDRTGAQHAYSAGEASLHRDNSHLLS